MHHLHFRYVTEQPRLQSARQLFQLLDDVPGNLREPLLTSVFLEFGLYSDDAEEDESRTREYRALKSKIEDVAAVIGREDLMVYGLICFILGNVHARCKISLPHLIDDKRELIQAGFHTESASLQYLRNEQDVLRNAYTKFCEMVVGPLLGDVEVMDFGDEWAFDDSDLLPIEAVKAALLTTAARAESSEPSDPIINAFLDQLAADFEVSIHTGIASLAIRVMDTAVSVDVGEYSAPSKENPNRPRVLRLYIKGLSLYDAAFRQLGLPFNPKYHSDCRLEFSVLPNELPLLPSWTADWIRGQIAKDPSGPPIPILLAGEQSFFNFAPDAGEAAPHIEQISEVARAAFSSGDPEWLSINYLWSKAAREAYNAWSREDSEE